MNEDRSVPLSDRRSTPQSAEALSQSAARMRALLERAAFGIFRCAPDGNLVDANQALAVMLGAPSVRTALSQNLFSDICAEDTDRARCESVLTAGRVNEWYDLTWRRLDGTRIRVRLSLMVERDADGAIEYIQGIVEDVTERMRRDALVRRGERMAALGRTLAGVAHEINNPLAAITGFAQILLKRDQSNDDRHAHETILHEARRASRIVKDLVAVAGREEAVERSRVDLNAIIIYIVETQRYAMETHGVRVFLDLDDARPHVLADSAQLEQMVLNLVINARQALEEFAKLRVTSGADWTPTLQLTTRLLGGLVEFEVADNGPGIPGADLPHIFDPFWTSKDEGEGSGLGLSVVHGILSSHHGTIDVVSAAGLGTRFLVTIPANTSPAEEPSAARGGVASSRPALLATRPLDVLIVDDEEVIRDLLRRFLSMRGHAVVVAADGLQALRLADKASFDVVISDLRMPGIDGREVIRRLRALPSGSGTRFVLSTGEAAAASSQDDGDRDSDVITVHKPYDMDTLVRLIEGE